MAGQAQARSADAVQEAEATQPPRQVARVAEKHGGQERQRERESGSGCAGIVPEAVEQGVLPREEQKTGIRTLMITYQSVTYFINIA